MTATDTTPTSISRLLADLRRRLRGSAFVPGEDGYDAARAAWNLNAEHRPRLVVVAEHPADIRLAVRFACRAGLGVG